MKKKLEEVKDRLWFGYYKNHKEELEKDRLKLLDYAMKTKNKNLECELFAYANEMKYLEY